MVLMNISNMYVKILRWGIFISLFSPLIIFSQYLSPFHFGKMVVFRSLVEIMAIFYILLILIDKRYRPRWSLIMTSFSIFVGLYFFTGLIGVNFYQSFWGTLERMGGIFSFLHFWIYFMILTSVIRNKEDWHKVLKISAFVGFLSILFAYGQRLRLGDFFVGWQHGERVIGTIGNPALFAGYLLFIIYLALLFLLKKETPIWQRGFFASVIVLGIPVITMTAVRGAILSLFGSAFLLALFFIFTSKQKKIKISLIILIIIFIVLAIFVFTNKEQSWIKNTSWLNKLTNLSGGASTVQTRLWSWDSAIQGWKERPVFGWGPENFSVLHMKHFDARHFTHIGSETIWDRAHNTPLNALATMGIVGLLSYLSIFFSIFYVLIKKLKSKRINKITFGVLSAMIIAYFGQNLFIFDTTANYFLFFLSLGYINYLSLKKKDRSLDFSGEEIKKLESRTPSIFFISILVIIAIVLIYQFNIKPAMANFACTRGIITGRDGNAQRAIDKYREALEYNTPQGGYEIRHKLATFSISYTEHQKQKLGKYDPSLLFYSIDQVSKNIDRFPLDTIPYLYVGRMYILLIDQDPEVAGQQAIESIERALALNDKNPRIWYELGQAQMSLRKYEESYNSFKAALELNPKVNTSWWFLAVAAFQANKYEEALTAAEKALEMGYSKYKDSIADIMRLVNIYEKVEQYDRVVEFYELAVLEKPNDPQIYASLAAAYAKTGQYEKAIKAAQAAAQIDPTYKDESEAFINSLNINQ